MFGLSYYAQSRKREVFDFKKKHPLVVTLAVFLAGYYLVSIVVTILGLGNLFWKKEKQLAVKNCYSCSFILVVFFAGSWISQMLIIIAVFWAKKNVELFLSFQKVQLEVYYKQSQRKTI